jgi:hypothetical protein
MGQFVREGQAMLRRVIFENLASNDDPDITFLDDYCQKIRGFMKAPVSYTYVLLHLTVPSQQARLAEERVGDRRWRAMFRCQHIGNA